MNALFLTIVNRPYVVAFLLTFLILATLHFGYLRTLFWLIAGYLIAFISEYSSIHNGIPYGLYHYLYDAMAGELILAGVPMWDSVSYAFIAYASFSLAWFFVEKIKPSWRYENFISPAKPIRVILLGSLFMMLADVIIDPVAHLGDRWFLGKIYFYAEEGIYFGVPISNFAGWLLVAFLILSTHALLEKYIYTPFSISMRGAHRFAGQALLGPLFYFSILIFNIAITFYIGEAMLAWVGLMISLPIFALFMEKLSCK